MGQRTNAATAVLDADFDNEDPFVTALADEDEEDIDDDDEEEDLDDDDDDDDDNDLDEDEEEEEDEEVEALLHEAATLNDDEAGAGIANIDDAPEAGFSLDDLLGRTPAGDLPEEDEDGSFTGG